eukprot:207231-Pleurochrysis_carterae.AAC.1
MGEKKTRTRREKSEGTWNKTGAGSGRYREYTHSSQVKNLLQMGIGRSLYPERKIPEMGA